jgi:hypothetical protein
MQVQNNEQQGVQISTRSYKKNDPTDSKDTDFVFTENAQALAYTHKDIDLGKDSGIPTGVIPKVNVSDANGTNTAVIRTDSRGITNPNAYGIVVKKYQQSRTGGTFVAQEGCFSDTDADFELFKRLNNYVFDKLQQSKNSKKVFPSKIALGRAALPERFVTEYLQPELEKRFGLQTVVKKNKNAGYNGYGLEVTGVNNQSQQSSTGYTLFSGGAPGADGLWGEIGKEMGVLDDAHMKHFYSDQKTMYGNTRTKKEDDEEGAYKVAAAAKENYGYRYSTMKDGLLLRNWSQVKYADAIFAIGNLVDKGERLFPEKKGDKRVALKRAVTGGTGYAVEMAIQAGKPVYLFNQKEKQWYKNTDGKWEKMSDTPTLTKNFAGIGTRGINSDGEQAIRDVYEKTINSNEDLEKLG